MYIEELLSALSKAEVDKFRIDNNDILDYLFKDDKPSDIKQFKYDSLPLDIHFVVKQENKGKIESHLWFFNGFCQLLNPEYATIIDAGTIPLWNSLSKMTFYLEKFKNVGGACGEIEVMLPKKKNREAFKIYQNILLKA
mmetsp:Transcript_7780/g.6875  ORF Transcript_7780/g.6875 Transcript_7780/m.6875 type:complete len:139 (+) Transcript_7780:321-737(+)